MRSVAERLNETERVLRACLVMARGRGLTLVRQAYLEYEYDDDGPTRVTGCCAMGSHEWAWSERLTATDVEIDRDEQEAIEAGWDGELPPSIQALAKFHALGARLADEFSPVPAVV